MEFPKSAKQKDCTYNGETFEHGSEVKEENVTFVCDNGEWIDREGFEWIPF